jgi:hypothetical protein
MRAKHADPESSSECGLWIPGSRQRVRAKRGPMTGSERAPE